MQTLICQMPSSSITGMLCSLLNTTNLSSAVSTYDAGSLNYYLTTTTKKELLDLQSLHNSSIATNNIRRWGIYSRS